MWKQYVQMKPMSAMLMRPLSQPLLWNASCIARIPVPRQPLRRWASVSEFLRKGKSDDTSANVQGQLTMSDEQLFCTNVGHNLRPALQLLSTRHWRSSFLASAGWNAHPLDLCKSKGKVVNFHKWRNFRRSLQRRLRIHCLFSIFFASTICPLPSHKNTTRTIDENKTDSD